jgi:hypothetical protein
MKTTDLDNDITAIKTLSRKESIIDTNASISQQITEEQIKLLKRELGLNGNIDFTQNLTPNVGEVEENIIYQRRLVLGVEWNFLKNGFTDNYFQRKSLEQQLQYDGFSDQKLSSKNGFIHQMNQTITLFNLKKIDLLQKRAEYIEQENNIAKNLFLLKQIKHEDYIDIQSRRAEIKGMQSIYDAYNRYSSTDLSSISELPLPLIDLNYSFLGSILNESDSNLINQFDWELVADLKNKWWNEISARLYTQYNFYDLAQTDPGTRSYFSLGLNVKIPLVFNHKIKKNIDLMKLEKSFDRIKDVQTHDKEELLNLVYEFRYKLKQYINLYQKKLMFEELLRKEEVKLDFNDADFNPIKGIHLVDDILRIDIELHDLLQNLYIKALRIHFKLEDVEMKNLVYQFELPRIDIEENQLNKGIFIWSSILDSIDPAFTKQYLIYNKYDHVFLAAKEKDAQMEKKKKLLQEFSGNRYLMIGNNKLINDPNPENYLKNIINQYDTSEIDGIHLDVEPHTFDDWKTNKAAYLSQYLTLIKKSKELCDANNLELNISIPLHYGEAFTKDLFQYVNHIDFMCYENVKQSYLVRKLTLYPDFIDQIGISLRTEDFSNKIELQSFAIELSKATAIKRINFHSLKRLIKMDEEYLNLK